MILHNTEVAPLKCFVLRTEFHKAEKIINEWLEENRGLDIYHIDTAAAATDTYGLYVIITFWYH